MDSRPPAATLRPAPAWQRAAAAMLATLLFWGSAGMARADDRRQRVRQRSSSDRKAVSAPEPESPREGESARERQLPTDSVDRREAITFDGEVGEYEVDDKAEVDAPVEGQPSQEEAPRTPLQLPSGPAKTAVTPQHISLPKGEGSIEGMGESFTPNLSAGTGTYSVPIALPPGRAGVQPSLGLSYSTGAGNGPLGIGWSMGAPFISRQTDRGLPRYDDQMQWHAEEDTFMYNGGQELVPVNSAEATRMDGGPVPAEFAGWQQYRARVEGGFMRFFRSPDAQRWVVQSKDGTRFDFGYLPTAPFDSRQGTQSDPFDESRHFRWSLTRMSDVHGASVYYTYLRHGGQLYLDSLYYDSPAYCGVKDRPAQTRDCAAPLDDYGRRVRLVYQGREDVTTSFVTTWRVETALRLRRIEVTSAMDVVGARTLVRRYHLTYDPDSYHSLLTQLQVEGRPSHLDAELGIPVGDTTIAERDLGEELVGDLLPPMRFGYSSTVATTDEIAGFGGIDATVIHSPASPEHSVHEAVSDLFDVNADGLPDLLVTNPAEFGGGVGVYFNGFEGGRPGQAGGFGDGVRVSVPLGLRGTLNLANLNVVPMDIDGDGHSDLLHMPRAASYGYFVLSKEPTLGVGHRADAGWAFRHVPTAVPRGETDPRIDLGADGQFIKVTDVNNDHLIDVVRTTGTSVQTWLNLGHLPGGDGRFGSYDFDGTGYTLSTTPYESCLPFAGRSLDFSDPTTRFGDMNGDGLQDIVSLQHGSVFYWPGRGVGAWGDGPADCEGDDVRGREVRMGNAPRDINPEFAGVYLMDANADGTSDLVQVGFDEISVWFNRGGAGFTDRIIADGTPFAPSFINRIRIADIDGSGTADIVYGDSDEWKWVDPAGGQRPRLLTSVDNGLGALTTLEYASSIEDYLRDLETAVDCDALSLDCFTWSRQPRAPNELAPRCDKRVEERGGGCAHRGGGSPVVTTVVRATQTTDRLDALGVEASVSRTEYAYHNGYYEGIEQEFRGFGAADAVVIGDAQEPTSITRTFFHQGRRPPDITADRVADNPNEALKGRSYLTETFDRSGTYLSSQHATYTVRELMRGLNGRAISYAYVGSSDDVRYDTAAFEPGTTPLSLAAVKRERAAEGLDAVEPAPMHPGDAAHALVVRNEHHVRLRSSIDEVDNVGNMRVQRALGRDGVGVDGSAVPDETVVSHTVPVRVDDSLCGDTGWLWRTQTTWVSGHGDRGQRLGYSTSQYSPCGDLLGASATADLPPEGAYDFSGSEADQPTIQADQVLQASSAFDAWGQPVESCGGADLTAGVAGCLRYFTAERDTAYQRDVVRESVATGRNATGLLHTRATWDAGLGTVVRAVDPNGLSSEVFHDGLGRVRGGLVPNVQGCEGKRVLTSRVDYELTTDPVARPLSRIHTEVLLDCDDLSDVQEAYAYVDGLGRPRAALSEGDPDPSLWEDGVGHAWLRGGITRFTTKGQPAETWQPDFFDADPNDLGAVLTASDVPSGQVQYDAFGRALRTIAEDGSYSQTVYHALSSEVCDFLDLGLSQVQTDDHFRDTCSTERIDGHGRSIDAHLRNAHKGGTDVEHHRLFTYYRADGQVTGIVRASTTEAARRPAWEDRDQLAQWVQRTFTYDSAGRRIGTADPETDNPDDPDRATRSWRYQYNEVGDLGAVRDPRGCGQDFYYDLAGRLIGEQYIGCGESHFHGEDRQGEVPVDSVGPMGFTERLEFADVQFHFDTYPAWLEASGVTRPADLSGTAGLPTGVTDRAQRSVVGYDKRGQAVWTARQMAVVGVPAQYTVGSLDRTQGPTLTLADRDQELPPAAAFDEDNTYEQSAVYDHAGRQRSTTLPVDPSAEDAPRMGGTMAFDAAGQPKSASVLVDGVAVPVVRAMTYTRDGLMASTVFGDDRDGERDPTVSLRSYDERRRPTRLSTVRQPQAVLDGPSLSGVGVVQDQELSWDEVSNLVGVSDHRVASEWPEGHLPRDTTVGHDALYRVSSVAYAYASVSTFDRSVDWRETQAQHAQDDPLQQQAPSMLPRPPEYRVMDLQYKHDWLANMVDWTDGEHAFFERSIGRVTNGGDLEDGEAPAYRPGALYIATNLDRSTPEDLGGWVIAQYGVGGNLVGLQARAQCTDATGAAGATLTCEDEPGRSVESRSRLLRENCSCKSEQYFAYRWDELNRMAEAFRFERDAQGRWKLMARHRYRYDSSNVRTLKQVLHSPDAEVLAGRDAPSRATLVVAPGDYERCGVEVSVEEDRYVPSSGGRYEAQYLIAGARVVWRDADGLGASALGDVDADHRITVPITNLIQSTSAVVDLVSGELVESATFYPNGARESWVSSGEEVALEPAGFTGKEADSEVGLVYFGERYLVPRLGRWASPDPLWVHSMGGGEALNAFHYVSGNLLQARDPLGLSPFSAHGRASGGKSTTPVGRNDARPLSHSEAEALSPLLRFIAAVKDFVPGRNTAAVSEWSGALRDRYVSGAKRLSADLLAQVRRGDLSIQQAAKLANAARNALLGDTRAKSPPLLTHLARLLKETGYTLDNRRNYYAQKLYKGQFSDLSKPQQTRVDYRVAQAAGRTNAWINGIGRVLRTLGRGAVALSAVGSAVRIAESRDPMKTSVEEVGGTVAGMASAVVVAGAVSCPETAGAGCLVAGGAAIFGAGAVGGAAGSRVGGAVVDGVRVLGEAVGTPATPDQFFDESGALRVEPRQTSGGEQGAGE